MSGPASNWARGLREIQSPRRLARPGGCRSRKMSSRRGCRRTPPRTPPPGPRAPSRERETARSPSAARTPACSASRRTSIGQLVSSTVHQVSMSATAPRSCRRLGRARFSAFAPRAYPSSRRHRGRIRARRRAATGRAARRRRHLWKRRQRRRRRRTRRRTRSNRWRLRLGPQTSRICLGSATTISKGRTRSGAGPWGPSTATSTRSSASTAGISAVGVGAASAKSRSSTWTPCGRPKASRAAPSPASRTAGTRGAALTRECSATRRTRIGLHVSSTATKASTPTTSAMSAPRGPARSSDPARPVSPW
mmetsp:Transcript_180605/g.573088  ORF Transcript_180605/g.573088 Transcript_180605/m.573088 type:complete len:308 (-) Transcript_180605:531-1454(-)